MKTFPPRFKPATTAADCRDWLSPDDVLRLALSAFYAASRYYDAQWHPSAQYRFDGRRLFADDLAETFAAKLQDFGFRQQAPTFDDWTTEIAGCHLVDTPDRAPAREPEPLA